MDRSQALGQVAAVAVGVLLAGCTDPSAAGRPPVAAADLPDNLCAVVPATLVQRWSLVEVTHVTRRDDDLVAAGCTMSGDVDGDAVSLRMLVTTFGGRDAESVAAFADEALDDACATLDEDVDPEADPEGDKGPGRFVDSGDDCTWTASSTDDARRGDARAVALLTTSPGLAHVAMRHTGAQWELVPAEVVVLGATLTQADLMEGAG